MEGRDEEVGELCAKGAASGEDAKGREEENRQGC